MKFRQGAAAAVLALCCACITAGAAGTGAFYTAVHHTHNVITAGNVHIALQEKQNVNGTLVDWPVEKGISGALPGQTVSKVVYVTNTGADTAWVRVKAAPTLCLADGSSANPAGLVDYVHTDTSGIQQPGFNNADWLLDGSGYYLYRTPLAPGTSTAPLFTGVALAQAMDTGGATVSVTVHAEGVQSAHNGTAVTQAVGWPAAS